MKNIIERILTRTQRDKSSVEEKRIGLEISEEFLELYLGKEPKIDDIIKEFTDSISPILLAEGNIKETLKMQHMLEIYKFYIDDKI